MHTRKKLSKTDQKAALDRFEVPSGDRSDDLTSTRRHNHILHHCAAGTEWSLSAMQGEAPAGGRVEDTVKCGAEPREENFEYIYAAGGHLSQAKR